MSNGSMIIKYIIKISQSYDHLQGLINQRITFKMCRKQQIKETILHVIYISNFVRLL